MIRNYTKKLLVFFIAIIGIVLLATLFGCNGKETSDPGYRDSTIQNWMESVVESAGYSTDEIAIDWNIVDPDRQEQANSTSNFDFREASFLFSCNSLEECAEISFNLAQTVKESSTPPDLSPNIVSLSTIIENRSLFISIPIDYLSDEDTLLQKIIQKWGQTPADDKNVIVLITE